MNKNDIVEIEITGITDEGHGVGRADGVAVFVPYALLGEVVKALIVKVYKNYCIGKLLDIVIPCENRVKSECEYFYKCGGCQLWNVDYETELQYKRQKVEDCLRRIGKLKISVPKVLGAKKCQGYRNKGQFPVSDDGIGIYATHSHRVVDVERCIIQDDSNPFVLKSVREWMKKFNIKPYCEQTHQGVVRHIYTRCGDGGVLVCIVTRTEELPYAEELVEELKKNVKNLAGVLQNINSKKTNVALGKNFRTLWGSDHIVDSIGDCRFKISPLSFYQVNKEQTKILYETAAEFAKLSGGEIVWDLYCGIGTIGQFMAKNAKKIVGIEVVPEAVENAKENAMLNGIENAEYYCGTAEEVAPKLKGERPDVVILDPPRKGCEESLIETVAKTKVEKVVYISCKPATLARDLKLFNELGYKTEKIAAVDMFPRTSHVECVVRLCRNAHSSI